MKTYKIAVVIYTHNRVDDARINIELIRNWKSKLFSKVTIIHSYNGKKDWYTKTKEDILLSRQNSNHQQGASDLIDAGIQKALAQKPDYVVILAADTWLLRPAYLEKIIKSMAKKQQYVASSPWGSNKENSFWKNGLATDFFILDASFAQKAKLFPLAYNSFHKKHSEVLDYLGRNTLLELIFSVRLLQSIERFYTVPGAHLRRLIGNKIIYEMTERNPVHKETKKTYERTMWWPKIHLATHHNPKEKQKILKQQKYGSLSGPAINMLRTSKDVRYYNGGHVKNSLKLKDGSVIEMH